MSRHPGRHRQRGARIAVILLAILGQFGCRSINPISEGIAAAVASGPGTRFALADHAVFPWEQACIFGPYSSDAMIDDVTGIQGAASRGDDIRSREDINVVMFIHDGKVVASVAHPRDRGDFGPEIVGKCFSRQRSVFVVRVPPVNSRANIGLSTQ